ncbi:hypothetical protein EDB85DRAFT_1898328 [Lactarius pseudohatsudake]|nr:hypothetical protein EDB85DRAFT_1898328 [Lactarius pseudohatsudake]
MDWIPIVRCPCTTPRALGRHAHELFFWLEGIKESLRASVVRDKSGHVPKTPNLPLRIACANPEFCSLLLMRLREHWSRGTEEDTTRDGSEAAASVDRVRCGIWPAGAVRDPRNDELSPSAVARGYCSGADPHNRLVCLGRQGHGRAREVAIGEREGVLGGSICRHRSDLRRIFRVKLEPYADIKETPDAVCADSTLGSGQTWDTTIVPSLTVPLSGNCLFILYHTYSDTF